MYLWKTLLAVTLFAPATAFAVPQDQQVFEDFEGFSPNTNPTEPIVLGTSPSRAALTDNAFAGLLGIGSLYHSGVRSWMVETQSTAFINFPDNNAAVVEFFVRTHPDADGDTIITVFDDLDQVIGSPITIAAGFSDPSDPLGRGFTLVSLTGDIDHITVENQATNFVNAIDDLGFTAVPEPASLLLTSVVLPFLVRRRRRA